MDSLAASAISTIEYKKLCQIWLAIAFALIVADCCPVYNIPPVPVPYLVIHEI